MKIAIGADHRGADQKTVLKAELRKIIDHEITWLDVGCFEDDDQCEYPIYAFHVTELVQSGQAERGILLCGSGVGMAIAANRFYSIYAALVWNEEVARLSREHDNSNIIVFGSDFLSDEQVIKSSAAWLKAEFLGGKYAERIEMIDEWGGLEI